MSARSLIVLVVAVCAAVHSSAQTLPQKAAIGADVQAQVPASVATPDSLIATLYRVISGGAGMKRDWELFRSLFYANARLMPTVADTTTKGFALRTLSPDDYVKMSAVRLEQGFFEREIFRKAEQYGHIYHAFSTYEARQNATDAQPFMRGINSIQLMHDGKRWWIVSILWDMERKDTPLPSQYMPTQQTRR